MKKIFAALLMTLASLQASAWDGVTSGKITRIEGVGGAGGAGNFDFRVYLSAGTPPCPTNNVPPPLWSYINAADANYKSIVSMLLMAQASNKTVTIYSNNAAGYCQIAWVIITD
ncbi:MULTISPECIES: hypothetical protein [unclassified Janthinobacterium]|uniref:hypothetical protein n=1 Tax=unclassified Janthinobacterium TaxID=2610881 RepID=UPI001608963C|nr:MULTISPECIES: hypothetical protein [unclassified Janthinobacterium]MBB5367517.1 hypothetical protein [Janthinobacterium sp. K2C7]MBB5380005.1 hypothetical protein [Janthinobacterium sp. K2Li3]MBB5385899.1 hypothetical protein [Janthinobacterium sp. K2E3]